MYKKLSNGISWVLHPFLLPLYLIVVLLTLTVFAHYPANVKFYLLWVVVLYAMIIPLLALGVLRSLGRISDFKVDNRRERLLPLLVVMNVAGVGNMMVPLMVAILCAGALASARLYLGCHNGQQVLAGFCGGFAVATLAVLFL